MTTKTVLIIKSIYQIISGIIYACFSGIALGGLIFYCPLQNNKDFTILTGIILIICTTKTIYHIQIMILILFIKQKTNNELIQSFFLNSFTIDGMLSMEFITDQQDWYKLGGKLGAQFINHPIYTKIYKLCINQNLYKYIFFQIPERKKLSNTQKRR